MEKPDRSNNQNYFDDTRISIHEQIATSFACEWHPLCSSKQLRQSLLFAVIKKREASNIEEQQIWADIQKLVTKRLKEKVASPPNYVPKIFRYFGPVF